MRCLLLLSFLVGGLMASSAHAAEIDGHDISGFRLSREEILDIASPQKLSHRIFYRPSKGPDAAWFDAVKRGDLETVKKMAEAGQNLEAADTGSLGQTALGWAAFIGYEDMVHYLVGKGANLFAKDPADVSSVMKSAILGKNVQVAQFLYPLLKDKIDINEVEPDGETMVMVAASNNRLDMVRYLLEIGADMSAVSQKRQQNALTYACERGYKEMVDLLIKEGAVNFKTGKPAC